MRSIAVRIPDRTQSKSHSRNQDALVESARRFRILYDATPSMLFAVDRAGILTAANRFAAEQLGASVDELVGRRWASLFPAAERDELCHQLESCFEDPSGLHRWAGSQTKPDGERLWLRITARVVEQPEPLLLIVADDATEARRLSEKLSYQATHDPMTQLINREELARRIDWVLYEARKNQNEHALCHIDLDQFRVINDTCGFAAGDELLRQISLLLGQQIGRRDLLARLHSNAFGVLLVDHSPLDALRAAERLRQAIGQHRFEWGDQCFGLGASVGLVMIDATCGEGRGLLTAADSACGAAKESGRDRVYFSHEADADLARRRGEMQWVARIHKALDENRFRLCCQPIVPVGDDTGLGEHFELLIRMLDDESNLISPHLFLPAAERFHLIHHLDRWVVEGGLDWLASNRDRLDALYLCSINLSGFSLGDGALLDFIVHKFDEADIAPEKICFEITETAAIANLSNAVRFIRTLKSIGCRFALDDFGSGLSSFAYLKSLPVDFLKIDGMFVKDILVDPVNLAIVQSITDIGHVMEKGTIAEFVESGEVLAKLREVGVDFAQGFGIGRPRLLAQPA